MSLRSKKLQYFLEGQTTLRRITRLACFYGALRDVHWRWGKMVQTNISCRVTQKQKKTLFETLLVVFQEKQN